jgi:hypothetical protein
MNKLRVWVSLTLAISFIVLSISGLLSFFLPYHRTVATIHTVFGFLFFLAVAPHIWNNFKNLRSYLTEREP